jgi:nucleotide-binding universal stress UspA family protein
MPGWNRICCPVDFSRASRFAMETASELALRFGGDLTLLHVVEQLPRPVASDTLASPPEILELTGFELERTLAEWRDEAACIATRPVDYSLVHGDPATEIARFAGEGWFDLVVMGTHGRTELEHAILGSVAEKVVREAPCPVLVVRPRLSRAADRLAAP